MRLPRIAPLTYRQARWVRRFRPEIERTVDQLRGDLSDDSQAFLGAMFVALDEAVAEYDARSLAGKMLPPPSGRHATPIREWFDEVLGEITRRAGVEADQG